MTTKRGFIYGLILLCVASALWFLRRSNHKEDTQTSSAVLKPQEQEKLIINPGRHTLTTVTRNGPVKTTFLPPHVIAVTLSDQGKVTVQERQWGTEVSPSIGFAYSDKARLVLAVNLLYWRRWEVGPMLVLGVSGGPATVRAAVEVSYDVWSNTSLFVGVDNRGTPTGGISFKF